MPDLLQKTILDNPLIVAFAFVGLVIWISNQIAHYLTRGRVAGSAFAVLGGLALAYVGGALTGKTKGLADIAQFGGLALMGGAMMRDFTIVATASEVHVDEVKKAGWLGFLALVLGTVVPFIVGVGVAYAYGHRDPVNSYYHRGRRHHLYRRADHRRRHRGVLGRHRAQHRHRRRQIDHGDGLHAGLCPLYAVE